MNKFMKKSMVIVLSLVLLFVTVSKVNVKKNVATAKKVYKVAIDAGHQYKCDTSTEPIGPGSKTRKMKVTGGTRGVKTGVYEYQLNLTIAKKLEKELKKRGYEVYMCRRKHKVNISNRKRALKANKSGADIFIRIHANGAASSSVKGVDTLCMSSKNPYNKNLYKKSNKLSRNILNEYSKATGCKKRYVSHVDNMTGINWSKIPVTIVELGYMSCPSEDVKMQKKGYQKKMVKGLANGIDKYFK
ncbi:MAG: N-acetylmuramoyl-L-alanine amidase [Lachnospiraceae bacterium]|nr:N-acetylmuramoyl-L-alanine amidase [Lachnospiraceae bacterium]